MTTLVVAAVIIVVVVVLRNVEDLWTVVSRD